MPLPERTVNMKTVLLYNFSPERLRQVKAAVMLVKAGARVVEKDSYGKKLGFLVGVKGYEDTTEEAEDFNDELLVMSGFDSEDINRLITALRRTGAGRIDLKAIITPTNMDWNSSQLYYAVRADHEEMHRSKS